MGRSQVLYNRTKGRYKDRGRGGGGRGRGGDAGEDDGAGRGRGKNYKNNNNNTSQFRQRAAPHPESIAPSTKQQNHYRKSKVVDESILMAHPPTQLPQDYGGGGGHRDQYLMDEQAAQAEQSNNNTAGVARITELDMRLVASTLTSMDAHVRLRIPRHLIEPAGIAIPTRSSTTTSGPSTSSSSAADDVSDSRKNQKHGSNLRGKQSIQEGSTLAIAPSNDSLASSIQSDLIKSPAISPSGSRSPSKRQGNKMTQPSALSPDSDGGGIDAADGGDGVEEDHFWKNFAAAMNPFAKTPTNANKNNNDDTNDGNGDDDAASFSVGTRTRARILPDGAVEVHSKPKTHMISNLETVVQELEGTSSSNLSFSKEGGGTTNIQADERNQQDSRGGDPSNASEATETTNNHQMSKTSVVGGDDAGASIPFTLPDSNPKRMVQEDLTIPRRSNPAASNSSKGDGGEAGSIPFTLPSAPSKEESGTTLEGGAFLDEKHGSGSGKGDSNTPHQSDPNYPTKEARPSADKYLVNMMDDIAEGPRPVIGLDKYLEEPNQGGSNSSASGYKTAQEKLMYSDDDPSSAGDKMIVNNSHYRNPKDYFSKPPTFQSHDDRGFGGRSDDEDDAPSYATPPGVIKNKYTVPRNDKNKSGLLQPGDSVDDEDLEDWLDQTMNDNNNSKRSDIKNIKSLPTSMGEEIQLLERDTYHDRDRIMVGSDAHAMRQAIQNGTIISSYEQSTVSNTNAGTGDGYTFLSGTTTSSSAGSTTSSSSYTTETSQRQVPKEAHPTGPEGVRPAFAGSDSVSTLSRSTYYPASRADYKPDPPTREKYKKSSLPSPTQKSRPISTIATHLQPQRQQHVITSTLLPSAKAPPSADKNSAKTNGGGCWPGGRGALFGDTCTTKADPQRDHPFDSVVDKPRGVMAGGLPTTKKQQAQKQLQKNKKGGGGEDLEDWLDSVIS